MGGTNFRTVYVKLAEGSDQKVNFYAALVTILPYLKLTSLSAAIL